MSSTMKGGEAVMPELGVTEEITAGANGTIAATTIAVTAPDND